MRKHLSQPGEGAIDRLQMQL